MGSGPGRPLLVVLLLLLFVELPGTWLFDQDETRYAEVGREMLSSGDWLTPRLDGARYDEKPPITYWANAASMAVFGNNAWAARLPARLAALGTALLLLRLGGTAGAWAAAIGLASPLAFAMGRLDLTDGILSFFLAATLLFTREFLRAEPRSRSALAWISAAGLACGLGILAKGLVGIVIPGLVLAAWAVFTNQWRRVVEALLSPAPVIVLLVVAPWFLLMERAHPGFNRYFWWENHFARYAAMEGARNHGLWFPWAVLAAGFAPWLALIRWRGLRADPDTLFLGLWFLAVPAFFTLSRSTLVPYLLPSIPAGALLAARVVAAPGGPRWARPAAWTMVALQAAVIALLPVAAERRSWWVLAERAAREESALVVGYRCHANSFMVRLERTIPTVAHRGEMGSAGDLPPETFWKEPRFWARWDSGERVVALVRERDETSFRAKATIPPRVLGRAWDRVLLSNYEGPP